jgi:hypothetical protein
MPVGLLSFESENALDPLLPPVLSPGYRSTTFQQPFGLQGGLTKSALTARVR